MVIALWSVAVVGGFALSIAASTHAVTHASALAGVTRLPPFFVGMTLLAVGTDLPEIANSVVASASGHMDINVGDSVGSAATQATLVVGLLPFLAGAFATPGRRPYVTGLLAAAMLVVAAVMMADGSLARRDGALLIAAWVLGSWVLYRLVRRPTSDDAVPPAPEPGRTAGDPTMPRSALVWRTCLALLVVVAGATLAVTGAVRISEELGLPEFLFGFFALSLGTSLPELVVSVTAARRGESGLAVGDLLGASFVDSTLSVGIGPLLFPGTVTASTVLPAVLTASFAVGAVTLMFIRVSRHAYATGSIALGLYALFYLLLLR